MYRSYCGTPLDSVRVSNPCALLQSSIKCKAHEEPPPPQHHQTSIMCTLIPTVQFCGIQWKGHCIVSFCCSIGFHILIGRYSQNGALLSTRNCSLKKLDCFTDPTGQIMIYHLLKDHISTLNPQ